MYVHPYNPFWVGVRVSKEEQRKEKSLNSSHLTIFTWTTSKRKGFKQVPDFIQLENEINFWRGNCYRKFLAPTFMPACEKHSSYTVYIRENMQKPMICIACSFRENCHLATSSRMKQVLLHLLQRSENKVILFWQTVAKHVLFHCAHYTDWSCSCLHSKDQSWTGDIWC